LIELELGRGNLLVLFKVFIVDVELEGSFLTIAETCVGSTFIDWTTM